MATAITTNAEVARLLRGLRREIHIRPSLLGSRVQSALGAPSVRAAVEMLVNSALRHAATQEAELLRLIIAHEYAQSPATRKELAAKLGMSERSYYRRRQEALQLIQREIETLLAPKQTPDAMQPILALIADYDPGSAFNTDARLRALAGHAADGTAHERTAALSALESAFRGDLEDVREALNASPDGQSADEDFWREEARFIAGRCSGTFEDMETAAQRMQRLLPVIAKEYQIETYLYLSELLMYRGDFAQAMHYTTMASAVLQPHRSVRHRLTVLLRNAQLAMVRGDDRTAYDGASTVSTAARHHFDLKALGTDLLGRVRKIRPLPAVDWNAHGSHFYEGCFKSVISRQYLARGKYDDAWNIAQEAYYAANQRGYGYLAARCAATLHLCLRATAPAERGPWAIEALRRHIRHGNNCYIGADLFDIGLADSALDDYLLEQLASLYAETHPDCPIGHDPATLTAVLYYSAVGDDAARAQLVHDFGRILAQLPFEERKLLLGRLGAFLETIVVLNRRVSRDDLLQRWKQRLAALANLANRELARRRSHALLQ